MKNGNGRGPTEVEWLPNHTARMVDPAWSGPSPDANLSFVLVKTGLSPLACVDLADALEAAAHEIREALTAAHFFTAGSKRALRLIRPDHVLCDQGLARATEQLTRATRTARLIRQLSEQLGRQINSTGPRSCQRISNESGTWKDSNQAGNCKS
jgi:hypothetical protein